MQTAEIIVFPALALAKKYLAETDVPAEPKRLRPAHAIVKCRVRDIREIDDALFQVRKALTAANELLNALVRND